MKKKIKIGLVYGGKSGEHEVSLQTALAVIRAFDLTRYEILPFYISPQGVWHKGPQIKAAVENKEALLLKDDSNETNALAIGPLFKGLTEQNSDPSNEQIDVIFPLLHGTFGEDGTIQGLLEMAGIPYIGAGVMASAVGMDKIMMKKIFAQEGLPQCEYRHFTRKQWEKDESFFVMEVEIALGYPCFVKPANLGSSVGISKAFNRKELIQSVNEALRYDRKVIIEEFIDAREIEIGVLGNDEPEATVPGEIVASNEFYDYKAKYVDGKSALIIPAGDLSSEQIHQLREMAIEAFQAIDASGLSRVDFFLRKSDGAIMINEINTMPGFTPYSVYPLLWQESGKSYSQLIDDLIELAVQRYNEKQKIQYGFE
jgi:D-alanine-D-alanine ligase